MGGKAKSTKKNLKKTLFWQTQHKDPQRKTSLTSENSSESKSPPRSRVLSNGSQPSHSYDTAVNYKSSLSSNSTDLSSSVFSDSQKVGALYSQKAPSPDSVTKNEPVLQREGPLYHESKERSGRVKEEYRGENEISDMKYLVEEGPLSFRAIAFLGGFFMIFASVLDLIDQDAGDLTVMGELINVFLWFFGIIVLTLEGRPFNIQIPFLYQFFVSCFACFRFVWGRGFFYFVGGCLQFFLFTKYDMFSGFLFMILGVISVISGYKASVKLAGLRNSISSKSDIKHIFYKYDKDRDGFLNIEEFRVMMISANQHVDYNEFVAALSAIDVHNNQQISIQDMEQWYLEYSEDEMPPGMKRSSKCIKRVQQNYTNKQVQSSDIHLLV